jgi:hypothetical protein
MNQYGKRIDLIVETYLERVEDNFSTDNPFIALRNAMVDVVGPSAAVAIERLAKKRYELKQPRRRFGRLILGQNDISKTLEDFIF